MSAKGKEKILKIVRSALDTKYIDSFTITYNAGHGHFTLASSALFTFTLKDFKRVVDIIEIADDRETVAAYVNLKLRAVYDEAIKYLGTIQVFNEDDQKFKNEINDFVYRIIKLHDILAKNIEVAPLVEVKKPEVPKIEDEQEIQTSENITELKKCNVIRYIPTQVNPVWQNGKVETFIGYNFSYRGMPLQVYRADGWENRTSTSTRVYIVDPVIGLPLAQYDGMLSDLESKLDEVFIKYLQTIESNKEAIVLIADAFKKLKEAA